MSPHAIGCSLAEAAESDKYNTYLRTASQTPSSMHVVYINTSLVTKAVADSLVPTITCTSSNVVQTILQGFAQVGANPNPNPQNPNLQTLTPKP
jgi:quinolinate synthase